jgi:DNA-nicking Smr family endonuclease
MGRIVLDLHDIFRNGDAIASELERVVREAVEKKIPMVEIIPGKGSGQLKRKVIRFLHQPRIKEKYHRMEVDERNFGKIYVHFRF